MQKKIVSLAAPILIGIIALALGWFAHAALPLSAQAIVVGGHASFSSPAAPSAGNKARLTYQGRLTDISGVPINSSVNATFRLYDSANSPIYTATRTITPTNGLFTVYLGDSTDLDLISSTLAQATSIGVKVGSDPEMTPPQPLNSVVGHSENGAGVTGSSLGGEGVSGSSHDNSGVHGISKLSYGVLGESDRSIAVAGLSGSAVGVYGSSVSDYGVVGFTQVITRAGVSAVGVGNGAALEIRYGNIRVTGAGITTTTPVFIQQVNTDPSTGNLCTGHNYATVINNPLINDNPKAILIVTPNSGVVPGGFPPAVGTYGVFYDGGTFCGGIGPNNKWVIYIIQGTPALPNGSLINVMAVIP